MSGSLAARPLTQLLSLRQFLPVTLTGRGYAVVTTVGLVGRAGVTGGEESEQEHEQEQVLGYDPKFKQVSRAGLGFGWCGAAASRRRCRRRQSPLVPSSRRPAGRPPR